MTDAADFQWSFHVEPSRRVRIESRGSVWTFDTEELRYMRFPKHEAPRERPEWSDERAGTLQDGIWHPYKNWLITAKDYTGRHPDLGRRRIPKGSLLIEMPDGSLTVAPDARRLT